MIGNAEALLDHALKIDPAPAHDAIASGSPANNPRLATKEEIIELYKVAYGE